MSTATFTVPGDPVGKGRPRFVRSTGNAYTPEKTTTYEGIVAAEYLRQVRRRPSPEPLSLAVVATFGMPGSWSRRKRQEASGSPCCKRPDADNLLKCCADALNGIAFNDDSQIHTAHIIKLWGESGSLAVTLTWED